MTTEHLTVREAAERLRLAAGTVYDLVAAGRLRSVRVGPRRGRILVPAEALAEYLAAGARGAAPQPGAVRRRPDGGYRRLGV